MSTYARHFVSQRFGKSTVKVDMAGQVLIALPYAEPTRVAFAFEPERVAHLAPDPATLPEALMRIAIQQAHKLFILTGERGLSDPTLELDPGTMPWNGDLTGAPYGGATEGYLAAHPAEVALGA